MGGKLFNLPRMPRADYLLREQAVRRSLDRILGGAYRIPRYYGDKADFGDMDIIVPDRPEWPARREEIAADLGIVTSKTAGRLYSTVFDGLQTDFFAVAERFVDSTCNYMSFNDLGNLLGRICRRFNLKYGEEGLSYTFRRADSGHYKADLPVTQDFAGICAFLKLDHAAWIEGFATLTALYEWVIASPYFSVAPYLDDVKGTMTRRMQNRPTIGSFIDFLRERIARFLEGRRLKVHPRKTFIAPTAEPAEFLGFVLVSPGLRRLPEDNVRQFRNRLRSYDDRIRAGTLSRDLATQRVSAWVAHAAHANTWRLRTAIFMGPQGP